MLDVKSDMPMRVLSTLMMLLGLILALAVTNLPLPATDHFSGVQRLIAGGFAAASFGIGFGIYRLVLVDRIDRWSALSFLVGFAGIVVGFLTCIINHPAAQTLFGQ